MTEKKINDNDLKKILTHFSNENYSAAESLSKTILESDNENIFCLKILGLIYTKTSRKDEALKTNKKIVELSPFDYEALNNYALSLKDLNFIDESIKIFKKSIDLNPSYVDAYYNLSNLLQSKGNIEESITLSKKVLSLGSKDPEIYISLSKKLYLLHRHDEAINLLNQYSQIDSSNSKILNEFLLHYDGLGKYEDAINAGKKGLLLDNSDAYLNHNLGLVMMRLGKLKEAENYFNHAIKILPSYTSSHLALTGIKKFENEDNHLLQMKSLYEKKDLPMADSCQLAFAIGKAYEDLNDFEKSFYYYKKGNQIRKEELHYSIDPDKKKYKILTKNISSIAGSVLKDCNYDIKLPIFIVGMPRSGTTLVEQILSSHSKISSGGELSYVSDFGGNISLGRENCNKKTLTIFRDKYLGKIKELADTSEFVTDKAPLNFMHIPLISAALPEAKILLIERNTAATIWGNYKQCFRYANKGLSFAYSLSDLKIFYNLYLNYIKTIEQTTSIKFYKIQYDKLVSNIENEIIKIFDYLGLDTEANCFTPEKNPSAVSTASITQVRKKIYSNSSLKWKAYKPYLGGTLDNLDNNKN